MTETDEPGGGWRILTMGLERRTARALARSLNPAPVVVDVGPWSEAELEECPCGPEDRTLRPPVRGRRLAPVPPPGRPRLGLRSPLRESR